MILLELLALLVRHNDKDAPVAVIGSLKAKKMALVELSKAELYILLAQEGRITQSRPAIHDVWCALLKAARAKIERILFSRKQAPDNEIHVGADVEIRLADGTAHTLDVRIQDAIILALKSGAPFYITEALSLETLKDISEEWHKYFLQGRNSPAADEVKTWLSDLRPEDFSR